MKERTQEKANSLATPLTERRDLCTQNEARPHHSSVADNALRSETLKHWLQIESELMHARRGLRWISTFTP